MPFYWRLLLGVAVRLLLGAAGESEHRTAINRAYYAALGEARQYAERHGLVIKKWQSAHEQVWQHIRGGIPGLALWHRAALKSLGDEGIALRALRVQADYHLNPAPTAQDAQQAVGMSKRIINGLQKLP
jgi:hypothetical protein